MREWLTVIIALLILGVLLDGLRRVRAHRRESLRMSRKVHQEQEGDFDEKSLTASEFPSGGARVAAYRDPNDIEHINQSLRESYVASRMTRGAPNRIPEQVSLNLDSPKGDSDDQAEHDSPEPTIGDFHNLDDDDADNVTSQPSNTDASSQHAHKHEEQRDTADADDVDEQHYSVHKQGGVEPHERDNALQTEYEQIAKSHRDLNDTPAQKDDYDSGEEEAEDAAKMPDEVLIINVMARKNEMFAGPDLLDAMVSQGLKFGDMDIFHRHETADGQGRILFSVANIVVPGTFEVGAMEDFQTPGISMFLSLPCAGESLNAFNLMADAALAIADQLNGELKDEHRSVMTRQTIEHARQRVIEYERKRRLHKT